VDATDGITPETGESGGQPQYSIDGGANWSNTGATLTGGVNGAYQVQLAQTEVNQTVGTGILLRYKSAATAEARGVPIQVIPWDLFAANLPGNVIQIEGADATVQAQAACAAALTAYTTAKTSDVPTEVDIWTYSTRTLTGFGTLVASIATAVWAAVTRTLTSSAAPSVADIDAELTANHGAGSWTSDTGGTGTCTVTGTLTRSAVAAPQVQFVIKSSPGGAVQATGSTDENGQFVVQLDTGAYNVYFGPDSRYTFTTPTALTVATNPQATAFTCTAATYPTQGMNFGQMKAEVRGAILNHMDAATAEATIRQVTDEMLGIWVNQAHYQLDADLLWTKEKVTLASVAGQRAHALDTDIREIFVATYDGRELRRITTEEDIAKYDASDTSGDPVYWAWWAGTLRLYPAPDTSSEDIVLYTLQTPPALVAETNIPGVPPQTHPLIVAYARSLSFLYMGDTERSRQATELYLSLVQREKDNIVNMRGTPQVIRMDGSVI
jgi:hypothetical protein